MKSCTYNHSPNNHCKFFSVLFVCICWAALAQGQSAIKINEIIAANCTINTDEDGSYEDWIEITNTGNVTLPLLGCSLTNKPSQPAQWIFPQAQLLPGEYLIVWLSGKNKAVVGQPLHTNFSLDSGGDKIMMFSPLGTLIDSVNTSLLPCDISFGRKPDGSNTFFYFENPTPDLSNNTAVGFAERLKAPNFSVESGFFTNAFTLTLTSEHPAATIIYTLDGSDPDPDNLNGTTYQYKTKYREFANNPDGILLNKSFKTNTYSTPLNIVNRQTDLNKISSIPTSYEQDPFLPENDIFKGTVVKAKAIQTGFLPSKTITRSYFVTPQGNSKYTLPVISLGIDEDKLFSYSDGRYVAGEAFDDWRATNDTEADGGSWGNYSLEGELAEFTGTFAYLQNGIEEVNQQVGFRIHGNYTKARPLKSLRLYARDKYGKSSLSHNFFNNGYDKFSRLIMRNSGNDSYLTYFRDAFMQTLVKHLPFHTMDYQPTVAFINGEYWGIHNLRERIDDDYFKRVYDIDDTQLDVLQNYGERVDNGDNLHYTALKLYLYDNDLSEQSHFDSIETMMNIENYTDYQISEIFLANSDWPHNNILFWRKKLPAYDPTAPFGTDGRWHWAMYDTDAGYGNFENSDYNGLEAAIDPTEEENTIVLRSLLNNQAYKCRFINRFADLLNTTFLLERATESINQFQERIAPAMSDHIYRWSRPTDVAEWNQDVDVMHEFALERPNYQRQHIIDAFNLPGTYQLTVDVDGGITKGQVKLNTITLAPSTVGVSANPYPWSGIYFRSCPITLTAIAQSGYIFSHWSGASTATTATITLSPNSDKTVVAHFLPDPNAQPQPIYFFAFDNNTPNDIPLLTLAPSYQAPLLNGQVEFLSSLLGYPFDALNANWRHASMERRNKPTDINYRPLANNGLDFFAADIKGLQIRQPFTGSAGQNIMIFHLPTTGFKDLVLSFAVIDELAAQTITIDYSTTTTPQWVTAGLQQNTFTLSQVYQLMTVSFANIVATNNNPNFKVRIRFGGNNMALDEGNRVTFNNFCLDGKLSLVSTSTPFIDNNLSISPNPAQQEVNILSHDDTFESIRVFNLAGQEVLQHNKLALTRSYNLDISRLPHGLYLAKVQMSTGKIGILKVVKQ